MSICRYVMPDLFRHPPSADAAFVTKCTTPACAGAGKSGVTPGI